MFITGLNRIFTRHGRAMFAALTVLVIIPFVLYFSATPDDIFAMLGSSRDKSNVSMRGRTLTVPELQRICDLALISLSLQINSPVAFRSREARDYIMDQALERARQLEKARAMGFRASPKEIAAFIERQRLFQANGAFSDKKLLAFVYRHLEPYGITRADLDEAVEGDIILEHLKNAVRDSVVTTRAEAEENFLTQDEKFKIKFAEFTSASQLPAVPEPDDAALQAFLDANAEKFMTTAQYKASVVRFNYIDFEDKGKAAITEDKLKAHYDSHIADYSEKKPLPLEKVKDKIAAELKAARARLTDEDKLAFVDNALRGPFKYMGRPEAAVSRQIMREVKRDHERTRPATDAEIEDHYGKNSSKYSESVPKPFDSVQEEIRAKLTQEEIERLATADAQRFAVDAYNAIQARKSTPAAEAFAEAAAKKGLKAYQAGPLDASVELIEGLGKEPALAKAIAQLHMDEPVTNAVKGNKAAFVACLSEKIAPRPATLAERKADVLKAYKDEKALMAARDAAKEAAARVAKALKEGKPFAEAAAGVPFSDAPEFLAGSNPFKVPEPELVKQTVETMAAGEVSAAKDIPGGALIVFLESRALPALADFERNLDFHISRCENAKKHAAWDNFNLLIEKEFKTVIAGREGDDASVQTP